MPVYNPFSWSGVKKLAISQIPPVTDTYYTICDLYGRLRILGVNVLQINTETAAKTLNIRVVDDVGTTTPEDSSLNNDSYGWLRYDFGDKTTSRFTLVSGTSGSPNPTIYSPLDCHQFKVEIRNHSAAGTDQALYASIFYQTG